MYSFVWCVCTICNLSHFLSHCQKKNKHSRANERNDERKEAAAQVYRKGKKKKKTHTANESKACGSLHDGHNHFLKYSWIISPCATTDSKLRSSENVCSYNFIYFVWCVLCYRCCCHTSFYLFHFYFFFFEYNTRVCFFFDVLCKFSSLGKMSSLKSIDEVRVVCGQLSSI